ncbi:hypothetical protein [Nonomuraea cavernae]|uniref:Uncharacterized protein n=1 Tax=Nonomuraea cavernae TaxID=2045107 RepID=A0A917ZE41_9ACTN|nr:hypothetical protein [Nonomuraea cavernae]MCA2189509.1 hypothetical protein [Nonomuraea cavernae]GGO81768.1 hypothetical protein GCM10012289_71500 [Nonomuraea cavernae]
MAKGLGRERVRELLGLAVWEVELAVETGLLRRLPDRTFDPVSVNTAQADLELFWRLLAAERRCNATEAAARLGISAESFRRIAAVAGLVPLVTREIKKYGRALTVGYYRAADVDALADHARADTELRAVARAVARSEAAKKAALTRRANLARATEARAEVEDTRPAPDADPIRVLLWTAAVMAAAGVWPGPLRLLRRLSDRRVDPLVLTLREARLPRAELEVMLAELAERSVELIGLLVPPAAGERELGVPVAMLPADLPRFGDHLLAPFLQEVVSSPPSWLLEARADRELEDAAHRQARRAIEEAYRRRTAAQAAVEEAVRVASRLSDETVAEIFGLSVEVIRLLRPKSGRWSAELVAQLFRHSPPWLRDETAARMEIDRRRRAAVTQARRRAATRLSWRRHWAEAFGVPLECVPEVIGRPTPGAIEAARRDPPRWARKETPG